MRKESNSLRVDLIHRAAGSFYSIEELFSTISRCFPQGIRSQAFEAPCERARIRSVVGNVRWLRSLRGCDVIHQTGDIHYSILGVRRSSPVILTIHDLRFIEETRRLKRILFWWLWLYLPCLRANRVTVISEFTKGRLLALCRVNPEKVRVIPNCVSPEFVPKAKPWPVGDVRVLLVGTTENKNLGRIAAACAGLPVQFCILGRPTEAQKIELERHGVSFESHSGLSREQVVELYSSCDLVVFVSTYEGFGLPILEGQAVGRPVLTSNIAPMDAVAGDGALLVDPFDIESIRVGMTRLLNDEALRADLVQKGFENVAKYSAESVAGQYAELYREVLNER